MKSQPLPEPKPLTDKEGHVIRNIILGLIVIAVLGAMLQRLFPAQPVATYHAPVRHPTTKAVANVHVAERRYGGFDHEQRLLYAHGLQHIANVHQRPGQYTVGEVLLNERLREYNAKLARETPAPTAPAPDDAQRACDAYAAMSSGFVQECRADGEFLTINIDATDYEDAGAQRQKLIRAGLWTVWAKTWTADHPGEHADTLGIIVRDLAGNDLGTFNALDTVGM